MSPERMITSKEALIDLFNQLEKKLGSQPTKRQWAKHIRIPSDMVIRREFGNWTLFLQAMGRSVPQDNHQTTHGLNRSPAYVQWSRMKNRCRISNSHMYLKYGAKGIKVCDRWQKFENFLEDMGHPTPEKSSLDRIDPLKGYDKSNCRWASKFEQGSEHKSSLRMLTYEGRTMNLRAWERELGYKYGTLAGRLRRGLSFGEAIGIGLPTPPKPSSLI